MTAAAAALPEFARSYPNLASASLGAAATEVNDEFFGGASRMLSDRAPVFLPDKYDDHGKWMDGWETRRSRDRSKKCDWCVVRLAADTRPRGLLIDTRHFTGNYPPAAGVDYCPDRAPGKNPNWLPLMEAARLGADAPHYFSAKNFVLTPERVRFVRLNIYPNGGIARFRVFGEAQGVPPTRGGMAEVSSLLCGGRVYDWNDSHFGEPWVILKPDRATSMQDGWETRRRRGDGFDWLLVRLPRPAVVRRVEVDTGYFKGNFPDSFSLEAGDRSKPPEKWATLLPKTALSADKRHFFESEVCELPPVTMARLRIYPDGGVSRLRLLGEFVK